MISEYYSPRSSLSSLSTDSFDDPTTTSDTVRKALSGMADAPVQGLSPRSGNVMVGKASPARTNLLKDLSTCELEIQRTHAKMNRLSHSMDYEQKEWGQRLMCVQKNEGKIDHLKNVSLKETQQKEAAVSYRVSQLSDRLSEIKAKKSRSLLNRINPNLNAQYNQSKKLLRQCCSKQNRLQDIKQDIQHQISEQEQLKVSHEERIKECHQNIETYSLEVKDQENRNQSFQSHKIKTLEKLANLIPIGTAVLFSPKPNKLLFVNGPNSALMEHFQIHDLKRHLLNHGHSDIAVLDGQESQVAIPDDLVLDLYQTKPNFVLKAHDGTVSDSWQSYVAQHPDRALHSTVDAEKAARQCAQTSYSNTFITSGSRFTTSHNFGHTVSPPSFSFC